MINRNNDNILQEGYPKEQLDIKLSLWKKSPTLNVKSSTIFSSFHIYENRLLILHVYQNSLQASYFNKYNLLLEEHYQFQMREPNIYIDYQFIHPQTYLIKNSVFFICNYNRNNLRAVYYADLKSRNIESFISANKPALFRINYSLTLKYDFELILFGGFDDQMKLTNILDSYNISECDFNPINQKGQVPSPRHSHFANFTGKYLIIAGGSNSSNLFDRTYLQDMFLFDFDNRSWQQVKSNIPKNIGFGSYVQLNKNQIIYFSEEHNLINHYHLTLNDYQWTSLRSQKAVPPFRYQSQSVLDFKDNQIYIFGGFNFQKNLLFINQLDILQIIFKDHKDQFLEAYSGEMIKIDSFVKQPLQIEDPKEQKDNDLSDELTFEELLEQEKQLQEQDEQLQEQKKKKKNKPKKSKKKN